MAQITMKTRYNDVTYDVNAGVADTLNNLVRQHPGTTVVSDLPPTTAGVTAYGETIDELNARIARLTTSRDRARRQRDEAQEAHSNYFDALYFLRQNMLRDLEAGVHPGAIVREIKAALNTWVDEGSRNPLHRYLATSNSITVSRRQQEVRDQINQAHEPVPEPTPRPMPEPRETPLADWERELLTPVPVTVTWQDLLNS